MLIEILSGALGGVLITPIMVWAFLYSYERKYRAFIEMRDGFIAQRECRSLRRQIKDLEAAIYDLIYEEKTEGE